MNWQTSSQYPQGRAVEFALTAQRLLLVSSEEVLEYVTEAEHQDGDTYWDQFPTLTDALADFKAYRLVLAD